MRFAVLTVLFIAELFALKHYIKIMYPKIGWNTLLAKSLCSLIFVITAIFAQSFSEGRFVFNTMLAAFICSFFGDVFLHVYPKLGNEIVNYALGGVSFLVGHVLYIVSFVKAEKAFVLPENILAVQIASAAVLCIAVNVLMRAFGLKLGKFSAPVIIYSFALMIMVVKAVTLGYMFASSGRGVIPAFVTGIGAVMFAASDIVLASDFFTGGKDLKKKTANMVLYYGGQMLLAVSLLWINYN
ncbi:MAG: lysoplasmalogenase [Clostridia bacterium]|nr:lysoplasmalogenase [Clostridia bacterium]